MRALRAGRGAVFEALGLGRMMEDDSDDGATGGGAGMASLLPYDRWTEEALRQVVVRALQYAGVHGMPGEHHFYITFKTDHPGVVIPPRLRAQYPSEMTIVLQHQFWDLVVDEAASQFSIGLSFGGVASTLRVPLAALTAFADPFVQFGLRFQAQVPEAAAAAETNAPALLPRAGPKAVPDAAEPLDAAPDAEAAKPQVVSLDAFRRRTPPKGD